MSKPRILVVDDMAVFRQPIAAALESQGYETICAEDGMEALQIVQRQRPDLILLDVAMPRMDGIAFLKSIASDESLDLPPVILLTAVAEKDYVVQAGRLGVRDYLLKSAFSLEELKRRVERALHASPDPTSTDAGTSDPSSDASGKGAEGTSSDGSATGPSQAENAEQQLKERKALLRRSEVLERLEERGELKAFSTTVSQVLKLTARESTPVAQIAKTIKQDQSLAVKILRIANSSVYGRGEQVDSVEKAVLRIGLSQIRQTMLNMAVIDGFSSISIGEDTGAGEFWEHSIGCGLVAAEIARVRGEEEAERAFTMGLMHDVGRLLLVLEFAEEYPVVLETASELGLPLEQVEKRLLAVNHAECMDRLLHLWKFPRDLIDPIVYHHLSIGNIRHMVPRRVDEVATLALANRLAHALCLGASGNSVIYPTVEFCEALKLEPSVIDTVVDTIPEQADDLKMTLLSHSSDQGWKDRQDAYRATLAQPLSPIFVCEKPQFDAFKIFVDQLTEGADQTPNLVIIHANQARSIDRLVTNVIAEEEQRGSKDVPALILSPTGSLTLPNAFTRSRQIVQLCTPVRVARLLDAFNALLPSSDTGEQVPAAKAA